MASRASTTRWVPSGSATPFCGPGQVERELGPEDESADPTVAAASAKRTTPYMPSWSVRASADRPEPGRLLDQLLGVGGAVEEAEVGVAVQLGVGDRRSCGTTLAGGW